MKRNPYTQRYGQASLIGASSSASLNSRPSLASLATSSSVTGMNLYIPPYAQQPPREPSPGPPQPGAVAAPPVAPSSSFAQLGLPQSSSHHRNQSLPVSCRMRGFSTADGRADCVVTVWTAWISPFVIIHGIHLDPCAHTCRRPPRRPDAAHVFDVNLVLSVSETPSTTFCCTTTASATGTRSSAISSVPSPFSRRSTVVQPAATESTAATARSPSSPFIE